MTLEVHVTTKDEELLFGTEMEIHALLRNLNHQGITTVFHDAVRIWIINNLDLDLKTYVLSYLKKVEIDFTFTEQTDEGIPIH